MAARTATKTTEREERLATVEVRIADRLRQLRLDKGLTLAQLAEAAGTSQAFLSRVENHKVSITIAGLERLAHALNTSIGTFFEEDENTAPLVVCRAGEGVKARPRGAKGFLFQMVAAAKQGKLMEPLLVELGTAKAVPDLKPHHGEEFDYILEGECLFHFGKDSVHLRAGDSVYYDATVPHAAHAIPGVACRILVVVTSRDYLFHGDVSRLLQGKVDGK